MKRVWLLGMAFFVATAALAFAAKAELTIHREGRIAGVKVATGVYRLEISEGKDSFTLLQGKKTVVTAPCRVSDLAEDVDADRVVYRKAEDGGTDIVRIMLRDQRIAIEIAAPAASSALSGTISRVEI